MMQKTSKSATTKPAYRRPEVTELDIGKTATGAVFAPQPESISYIS